VLNGNAAFVNLAKLHLSECLYSIIAHIAAQIISWCVTPKEIIEVLLVTVGFENNLLIDARKHPNLVLILQYSITRLVQTGLF